MHIFLKAFTVLSFVILREVVQQSQNVWAALVWCLDFMTVKPYWEWEEPGGPSKWEM